MVSSRCSPRAASSTWSCAVPSGRTQGNVIVSLVAIHNGTWKGKHSLDGGDVSTINAFFEDSVSDGDPLPLFANAAKVFQGRSFSATVSCSPTRKQHV